MSSIKNISLFVPHVFPNFTQKYVVEAFSELGDVNRVDFVAKQDRDGKLYNAAYIHFNRWYDNNASSVIHYNIETNGSVKFYHDDSQYYWIVLPNTAKKFIPGERKPRIDIGECKSVSAKTPEKTPDNLVKHAVCPDAPKKPTYAQLVTKPEKLDTDFEEYLDLLREPIGEWDVEEAIMSEIEAEDKNLISIDHRYVRTIEEENMWLRAEVAQLRTAFVSLNQGSYYYGVGGSVHM